MSDKNPSTTQEAEKPQAPNPTQADRSTEKQNAAAAERGSEEDATTTRPPGQPGPRKLQSHFKGMPKDWEKNRVPKKET
ncbi:Uu.00g140130.m01.CDS01 [Anthostomella pinea]|uniref:Uu.00g140130.m01.CDS01 n=1 Tax=Anthostomella pinea TaxID=933095 RepID=A0AAI8YLB6_9PEZI|nr:Uu.00g140130.m01.CDS01 [Anthostomella pinea]